MYLLLIFNDQDNQVLNAIWMFDTFKQMSHRTKGLIKYSDINKRDRKYRTAKSFFRVIRFTNDDTRLYFRNGEF